ncbi:hypothetical protein J6590_010140 [Homalodisca vitripennis]|nr:hypothetical protein J6590_010140 [Homalodisca vitripennis]
MNTSHKEQAGRGGCNNLHVKLSALSIDVIASTGPHVARFEQRSRSITNKKHERHLLWYHEVIFRRFSLNRRAQEYRNVDVPIPLTTKRPTHTLEAGN